MTFSDERTPAVKIVPGSKQQLWFLRHLQCGAITFLPRCSRGIAMSEMSVCSSVKCVNCDKTK